MRIFRNEFDQRFREKRLHLAFVGMSGIGKSWRSQQLKDSFGFAVHSVDEAIGKALGFSTMAALADWMGFPHVEAYAEKQAHYLALEETMTRIRPPIDTNFILDTTGSVVHLSKPALDFIRQHYVVIGLTVSENMQADMLDRFFSDPKPVVWGDCYSRQQSESSEQAVKRCYRELLAFRHDKYLALSDISISGEISSTDIVTIPPERFWEILRQAIPTG